MKISSRFLDQIAANENNTDKLEKHRFLVQSKVIDEDQYDRIRILPSAEKTDELSKLWDGPKDDKKNIKLKVDFKYPDNLINSPITKPMTTIPENIESIRNKINPKSSSDNNSNSNNNIPSNSSPEVIFSELQNLRKKYDAVVEYTVHLTAERDSIVNQLDLVQRELNKEKSKKKEGSGSGKLDKNEKRVVEKVRKFYSLFPYLCLFYWLLGIFLICGDSYCHYLLYLGQILHEIKELSSYLDLSSLRIFHQHGMNSCFNQGLYITFLLLFFLFSYFLFFEEYSLLQGRSSNNKPPLTLEVTCLNP